MGSSRKKFDSKKKVQILKELLCEGSAISDLADKYGVTPANIYSWRNHLFSNAEVIFERKNDVKVGQGAIQRLEEKNSKLEEKLAHKNAVLSEITEEYIKAKKLSGAP